MGVAYLIREVGVAQLVREDMQRWGGGSDDAKGRLEAQIAEAAAHVDAATHRLLTLVREYDQRGYWSQEGFVSCAHWFAKRVGIAVGAAREHVRVAHALERLPLIDTALRTGKVSYSQVRAITRVADENNEAELLTCAKKLSAAELERTVRSLATVKAAIEGTSAPEFVLRQSYVRRVQLPDGRVLLELNLSAEEAAIVLMALDGIVLQWIEAKRRRKRSKPAPDAGDGGGADELVASGEAPAGEAAAEAQPRPPAEGSGPAAVPPRRLARGRAEALVYLAESRLKGESADGGSGKPLEVALFADRETLASTGVAWFADGTAISAETARRLTCSATLVPVSADREGNLLDIGRKSRVPTEKLQAAVVLRDRCCRFPGCGNVGFLDFHHIEHWAEGGPTNLDNLLLLCRRHHVLHHEGRFRCRVEAGQLHFCMPDGSLISAETLDRPGDAGATFNAWLERAYSEGLSKPDADTDTDPEERALAIAALFQASGLDEPEDEE